MILSFIMHLHTEFYFIISDLLFHCLLSIFCFIVSSIFFFIGIKLPEFYFIPIDFWNLLSVATTQDCLGQYMDQYENPYFLHSTDHVGLVLVSDRLTSGAEFHSWRRSVQMALSVRNKLSFIDGTIPKPSYSHRDIGSWSRCNDMVAT